MCELYKTLLVVPEGAEIEKLMEVRVVQELWVKQISRLAYAINQVSSKRGYT